MPRPRFKKLDPKKQLEILDTAEREFLEKGFGGASLNEIMKQLGISKGAAYYYFDDKADLFGACLDRLLVKINDFINETVLDYSSEDNFWQSIDQLCLDVIELVVNDPKWDASFRMVLSVSSDPQLSHLMEQIQEPYGTWILKMVVQGQEKAYLRQDMEADLAARLWMSIGTTFDIWMMERFAKTNEWGDLRDISKTYSDLIRRALSP